MFNFNAKGLDLADDQEIKQKLSSDALDESKMRFEKDDDDYDVSSIGSLNEF